MALQAQLTPHADTTQASKAKVQAYTQPTAGTHIIVYGSHLGTQSSALPYTHPVSAAILHPPRA
jgi:hypothetical protein